MRRGHICLEGYWRIDIILKESPGIKTGEWLPEKHPRHLSATVPICPQQYTRALLSQGFLVGRMSANMRCDPSQNVVIRRLWWGGLVGRLWPEDSCTSSPLAKWRQSRRLDAIAM